MEPVDKKHGTTCARGWHPGRLEARTDHALLKENLARIDAEHMPACLESSNPNNNHRYESVGFVAVTSFQAPGRWPCRNRNVAQ